MKLDLSSCPLCEKPLSYDDKYQHRYYDCWNKGCNDYTVHIYNNKIVYELFSYKKYCLEVHWSNNETILFKNDIKIYSQTNTISIIDKQLLIKYINKLIALKAFQ